MENLYDIIIIGAGPAGLAAGLYAGRAKMKTLILEKEKNGGQIVITHSIENYPGAIEDASGLTLTARMVNQCESFGVEIIPDTVLKLDLNDKIKTIHGEKETYHAKAVIFATGANPRKIGCPGEQELIGKGISYCATCDADFFTDLEVFVVGGGDSAIEEALYLTKFARKVTIVHRREGFRANRVSLDKARENPKIEWLLNKVVAEVKGDGIVEAIVVEDTRTKERTEIVAKSEDGTMGIFVFVGLVPQTELVEGILEMDEQGYLLSDEEMKTCIDGVFVAGDCRKKMLRQVVTAASDGAIAAVSAGQYIENNH